jgi:hypothetical protein
MLGADEDAGCEAPASWNEGAEDGVGVEESDGFVADASTYTGQLAVMRRLGAAGAGAARMRSAAAKLAELKHATWVPRGTVARKKKSKAAVVRAEGGGRGLNSFPFPLNLSLLCPFPLNLSLLCPTYNPN